MFDTDEYELIDFGNGRKWERFGGFDIVRPCPAADNYNPTGPLIKIEPVSGCVTFAKSDKSWSNIDLLPTPWAVRHRDIVFQLKPTPFGHLGIFCEQAANWDWINKLPFDMANLKAINLFGYTGGTTLALASRGAHVVHVDSARNIVNWARQNAKVSGLEQAPVRWIVDDAVQFLEREIRRGNKYDILVADPPAIGHADKKMTWKFDRDIEKLLNLLGQVASEPVSALLLSCHSAGFESHDLCSLVNKCFSASVSGKPKHGQLNLTTRSGRALNCGHYFRLATPEPQPLV